MGGSRERGGGSEFRLGELGGALRGDGKSEGRGRADGGDQRRSPSRGVTLLARLPRSRLGAGAGLPPGGDGTPSPWFPPGSRYDLSRLYRLCRRLGVGGRAMYDPRCLERCNPLDHRGEGGPRRGLRAQFSLFSLFPSSRSFWSLRAWAQAAATLLSLDSLAVPQ
jgi:hypothetical protein